MTTIATSVLDAVGRTPLIRLHRVVAPASADVLVKLESTTRRAPTRTGWRWR